MGEKIIIGDVFKVAVKYSPIPFIKILLAYTQSKPYSRIEDNEQILLVLHGPRIVFQQFRKIYWS
jgi:hypothetical protein